MSLGTLLTVFVVPTMYTLFARKTVPGAKKTVGKDEADANHADPSGQAKLPLAHPVPAAE
jgi:multidrug efflux pump